jgi:Calcineurin-like phosphoesterase superfamily domain
MIIGVISDTHGLLRAEALEALRGSESIVHAGDIGDPAILDKLSEIAPVTAVWGNVDCEAWARKLPETNMLETGGISIYVLHNIDQLDLKPDAAGFAAYAAPVISALAPAVGGSDRCIAVGDCGCQLRLYFCPDYWQYSTFENCGGIRRSSVRAALASIRIRVCRFF